MVTTLNALPNEDDIGVRHSTRDTEQGVNHHMEWEIRLPSTGQLYEMAKFVGETILKENLSSGIKVCTMDTPGTPEIKLMLQCDAPDLIPAETLHKEMHKLAQIVKNRIPSPNHKLVRLYM